MRVEELMTRAVKTVAPGASLKDVATQLDESGISGLPVCDVDGRVVGIVSEADILLKEGGIDRRGRLAWLLAPPEPEEVAKAEARTAAEAMTSPAITISPFRSVHDAVRLMLEHGINRLPVVKEDRLVGILTRADVVRAFHRPDHEIAREIREDVLQRTLWIRPGSVAVHVERGEVTLRGDVEGRSDLILIERLVARVPGVVGVTSELTCRIDDTNRKHQRELARTRR